ncbi:hypothetical protein C8J56DRAFT_19732 [Mycena floridula]|nr:hypothetical protein C8J56DRAFT_19732 [Mycena floridula]
MSCSKGLSDCQYSRNLPAGSKIPLHMLLSIAELARDYCFKYLRVWSMEAIRSLVFTSPAIFRHAPTITFIRLLRLSVFYGQQDLSTSIQSKWMSRLHWGELPSDIAIIIASRLEMQYFLSHAYYAHLVELDPEIHDEFSIKDFGKSPLEQKHLVHLCSGYHSLRAYWENLRKTPPTLERHPACGAHALCLAVWRASWPTILDLPGPHASIDVLKRLAYVEKRLKSDSGLNECMRRGCLKNALASVCSLRENVSRNLVHHFDL